MEVDEIGVNKPTESKQWVDFTYGNISQGLGMCQKF